MTALSIAETEAVRDGITNPLQRVMRIVTGILAGEFLTSAALNLGARITIGALTLKFSTPSIPISEFEILIGSVLIIAAFFSRMYVYGAAYLLATVGIAEGLLSITVQGLARDIHEVMVPFLLIGWFLLVFNVQHSYRTSKHGKNRTKETIAVLQFFVGGLVTLGGAEYAKNGTYPVGTVVGSTHLGVGILGILAGYFFVRGKPWSNKFIIAINCVTIVYSTFSESLAQIYSLLAPGVNDSLIGTVIAIIVSAVIIWLEMSKPERLESSSPKL